MKKNLIVITNPHPHLRKQATGVDLDFLETDEFKKFVKDLSHTMRKQDGIGLAAIQVDVLKRIICIHNHAVPKDLLKEFGLGRREDLILVNPEWFPLSQNKKWDGEGCLSVPGKYGEVERYTEVQTTALNHEGKKLNFKTQDFFARVIQHEIDHLNGVLFVDKARNITEG